MSRVKSGINRKRRHKKQLEKTKGFIGRRKNNYKISKQAYIKSLIYSYRDRKKNKSNMRRRWIKIINIYLRNRGIKYNKFIKETKEKKIKINRKMIFELIKDKKDNIIEEIIRKSGC